MMASRTWGTQSLVWVILGHRHLSRSAVPQRAPGTHRCSYRPGPCSARRSGMGWTHIHSPLQGEARKGHQVMCGHSQLTWCLLPSLDDAQEGEGNGQKKIGAIGSSKHSPPKTTSRNEADWEGNLPRYETSPSPSHTCFCHPPVWQSSPVYPDWHKQAAVLFTTWQLPPFWHTLFSHGDSAAEEHQKKKGRGVSLGTGLAHGTLYMWGYQAEAEHGLEPLRHLLSGDSGHVPSHNCPQNLSSGSSALSSHHTSWKSVCSAGHFPLPSFLPHKSTPFSPFPLARQLAGSQMLWQHFHWQAEASSGETCNHSPCQGLGGSPLALKSLGPEHHLQKQGLQGLFEHWLPAFLAKGVVVEECWQQC